ncbi:MAG: hypothetical protein HGB29_01135 [Chlorobiaceae bacterium]|nr:hypothetical protein [Chlorobiaceae bacterium]
MAIPAATPTATSKDGGAFVPDEVIDLLSVHGASAERYRLMSTASSISREFHGNAAVAHARPALTIAVCSGNCVFCLFAEVIP